jgi:hypothetical protein
VSFGGGVPGGSLGLEGAFALGPGARLPPLRVACRTSGRRPALGDDEIEEASWEA